MNGMRNQSPRPSIRGPAIAACALLAACSLLLACGELSREASEAQLLILDSERYRAGILPVAGGRLVLLRRVDGDNVLLAAPGRWGDRPVSVDARSEWSMSLGHIAWLGPQAEWWTHQDVDPQRRDAASTWPPDPYLTEAAYRVTERGPTVVALRGPHSPVSGVTLAKRYELLGEGLVIRTTCVNTGERAVAWDLWSNARFDGDRVRCFVPVAAGTDGGTSPMIEDEGVDAIPYRVVDGHLTLDLASPGDGHRAMSKYGIDPGADYLAAFHPDGDCVVCLMASAAGPPAPGQRRVEIYVSRHGGRDDGLLEVEHHGAYQRLEPGASMDLTEVWTVRSYPGPAEPTAQVEFLRSVVAELQASPAVAAALRP